MNRFFASLFFSASLLASTGCTDSKKANEEPQSKALANSDPKEANDENITNALNAMLKEKNPACVIFGSADQAFPGGFATEFIHARIQAERLEKLVKRGLLTSKKAKVKSMFGEMTNGVEIGLTEEGRKYYIGSHTQPGGLCVGTTVVAAVENYTVPQAVNGLTMVEVKYTYLISDIPAWAKDEEIQKSFGEIAKIVKSSEGPINGHSRLLLTNKGWTYKL